MGRYQPVESTVGYYDLGEVCHEFDETGNHRLQFKGRLSDWETYGGIAILRVDRVCFAGTTEYYANVLPEIFVVHSLKAHGIEELKHNKKKLLTMKERATLLNKGES